MRLLKGCLQWQGSNQVFTYADDPEFPNLAIKYKNDEWADAGWSKQRIPKVNNEQNEFDKDHKFRDFVLWFEYE